MKKYIFIFLWLLNCHYSSSTITYYRPMSKKSIDFGDDVCYYEDISDNSKLMYVKGCPSGKSCQLVGAENSEYRIHTCQAVYSVQKRNVGDNCDPLLYECNSGYDCTNGRCVSTDGTSPPSDSCTTIKKRLSSGEENCVTDSTEIANIGNKCYTQNPDGSNGINYDHLSSSLYCKKIQLGNGATAGTYGIISKELVDYYSIQDGDYVDDGTMGSNSFCQSGFSLYFFGNGGQILSTDTTMFKRCVTVLGIDSVSGGYYIKYKIKDGAEHIYDTTQLGDTYKTTQNSECASLDMTQLEILKYMLEEYKANGKSNKFKKWRYLYSHKDYYLLYKDQTDVLDYLIQKSGEDYIPEKLLVENETPNNQPTTTTQPENSSSETQSTDISESDSSGYLNIQYLIILLFLLFL